MWAVDQPGDDAATLQVDAPCCLASHRSTSARGNGEKNVHPAIATASGLALLRSSVLKQSVMEN